MKELTPSTQNNALKMLLEDPQGAYQRWRRQEAPYHEMCRAVVLAYCNRPRAASAPDECNQVFLPLAS